MGQKASNMICRWYVFVVPSKLALDTDKEQAPSQPQKLQAIARISNLFELYYEHGDPQKERTRTVDIEGSRGLVVCVTDTELKFCRLSIGAKCLPEQIFTDSNPTCLAYSPNLRKIIAGVERVTIRDGRRAVRPSLMTFQTAHPKGLSPDNLESDAIFGKPGEKIAHMVVWRPFVGENQYELLIIAANSEDEGRIIFLKTRRARKSGPELSRSAVWSFPEHVVHRLAPFGDTSLLIGVGSSLVLQTLQKETREPNKDSMKWRYICEYVLPSPAVGIAVIETLVYVTTERHSLQVLKVSDERFMFVESAPTAVGNVSLPQTKPTVMKLDRAMTSPTSIIVTREELLDHGPCLLMSNGTIVSCLYMQQTVKQVLNSAYTPAAQTNSTTGDSPYCKVLFQADVGFGLHKMELVSPNTIYGATLDGTVLQLTLLNEQELQLLKFLSDLVTQGAGGPGFRRISAFEQKRHKSRSRARYKEDNHINGDILLDLLDSGHAELECLLPMQSSDQFRACARAVVGDQDDYLVAAMTWLWRILQSRLEAHGH